MSFPYLSDDWYEYMSYHVNKEWAQWLEEKAHQKLLVDIEREVGKDMLNFS